MTVTPYAAYATADTFWAEYPSAITSTWTALSTANKTAYLVMATKLIDRLPIQGYKLLSTQALEFPRKYDPTDSLNPWGNTFSEDPYGYVYDSGTPPQDVIDACCWEAKALAEYYASSSTRKRKALQDQGVTSYSLGDLSESYGASGTHATGYGLHSEEAYNLLKKYLSGRADIR